MILYDRPACYSQLTANKLPGRSALDGSWSPHTCQDLLCRPLESLRVARLLLAGSASLLLQQVAPTEDVSHGLGSLGLVTDQLYRQGSLLGEE